jgi:hypothetical protein
MHETPKRWQDTQKAFFLRLCDLDKDRRKHNVVQQQQACQQFASKLQEASASGGAAAAQQTYKMGMEKLTGMFGSNPCPSVRAPQ